MHERVKKSEYFNDFVVNISKERRRWSAFSGPRWTTNFSSVVIQSFVC